MAENVNPVGLRHQLTILVTEELTVPAVYPAFKGFADMPAVFATAFMVGFVECACIEALRPILARISARWARMWT